MNDPIADMLIRIKNASQVGKKTFRVPYSKFKENLARILEREGFLAKMEIGDVKDKKELFLTLSARDYSTHRLEVKEISKPGKRVYVRAKEIKPFSRGVGLIVVSTPAGLMTAEEALKKNLGGEVICKII